MWLFDETGYPYVPLTDASVYEYDLRLMERGKLARGKFGSAVKLSRRLDLSMAVSYAGWKGAISYYCTSKEDGIPAGLWGPTIAPEMLLATLAERYWTCEFWLRLSSVPKRTFTIIDLGYAYERGVLFNLKPRPAVLKSSMPMPDSRRAVPLIPSN